MVAYNPEERPRIEKILSDEPWLKELNTLIKNNPEEYKKLEEEYINYHNKLRLKLKKKIKLKKKKRKKLKAFYLIKLRNILLI